MPTLVKLGKNRFYINKFTLVKSLFGFFVFLSFFLLLPKQIRAASCTTTFSSSSVDSLTYVAPFNSDVEIIASIRKLSTEIVESRYIYDGYGWISTTAYSNRDTFDQVRTTRRYSETRDFVVGGAWKIQGQDNLITCFSVARIFDRRTSKNFGLLTLRYPNTSASKIVTDDSRYIGAIFSAVNPPASWTGDHKGYLPDPQDRSNDWFLEALPQTPSVGRQWADAWNKSGQWAKNVESASGRILIRWIPFGVLTTFVTLELTRPTFPEITDPARYPESTFNLNDLVIYSRNEIGCVPNCPTPTPPRTATPTPTPTSTPVKVKNPYCTSFGFYPYGPYQDKGANGNTDNLSNTYLKYVSFTAPFTGKVNGLAIKAGNWGGAWRTISCKITNTNGTVNISQEASAGAFRSDSSVQWRKIAFPTQFDLTGGQQYRLYCRGSDAGMVYWIYDPTKNANNDLAKLYGRTYAVCMQ